MALLSRILAPVDFSPRCRGAVQYAEALACRFHCEIVLLHVVISPLEALASPEGLAYSSALDMTRERAVQSKSQLEAFLQEELRGVAVERVIVEGDPAREIVELARTKHCDLIVIPTHGYGGFRRFLLGSVTAKVLHDADCPVWAGPHMEQAPTHESISFRQIVCAIDLGPESRAVLRWANDFAREFGANIAVVHAIPSTEVRLGGFYFDPEWRMQLMNDARDRICHLLRELHISGDIAIETGDVPAAVCAAAERLKAALTVVGRGRAAGVLGRLRTNAYAIIRESPCPVVAV